MSDEKEIENFIDAKLSITNNPCDKIGKEEMLKAFKMKISPQQLLFYLKSKKIKYEPNFTFKNVKGVYTGVKFVDTNY